MGTNDRLDRRPEGAMGLNKMFERGSWLTCF